ncbi:MAG TPA: beta-N-acetylhexosaminidase [Terriglobales bacterium]|jgi:beta-N-acetylhexosaminidase|nr:beta-N-acetylhexosaminidase [Terriglobales bacterium]
MPAAARPKSSEQLGQVLVVGFDGTEMSPRLYDLLTRLQPAGVILFARNIEGAQQTHKLLKDCQACVRVPLFTCVDLEGGKVDRFRKITGSAPSAAEVFASGPKFFRKHGEIIGKTCRTLGFNVDFAPVLDLAFEASHSVMASRSVSQDPKQVIQYGREFLAGLSAAGVIGSGKHFPGLGEGSLDSHHDLPVIAKSLKRLWNEDLLPYRVMKRELRMTLISHANYPAVTRDKRPASLSKKWITGVLRNQIGYKGLVVSDDLEMGGVLKAARIDEAAVEFIRAGGDLCLICHQQEFIEQAFERIQGTFEREAGFRRRVAEAVKKTAAFKRKHATLLRMPGAPSQEKIDRLSRQLWEFSERVRLQQMATEARAGAGA